MAKRYSIGGNRYVVVKKQDNEIIVTIVDEKSEKSATLTAKRWAQFVAVMYQIDENLTQMLTNQYVKYNFHLGGAWCVSVTTGFLCVDIRKWYYNCALRESKPTKTGIALRLSEWNTLKELVHQIHLKHPALAATRTCSSQPDHFNQEGGLSCPECHPFRLEEMLCSTNE